jgi:hypothetical protein
MAAFMSHQMIDDRIMLLSVEDDVGWHGPPGDLHRSKGIHVFLLDKP